MHTMELEGIKMQFRLRVVNIIQFVLQTKDRSTVGVEMMNHNVELEIFTITINDHKNKKINNFKKKKIKFYNLRRQTKLNKQQ